ncbi:MAG: transposase [Bacteroidales bacterium]|nr:transposase [Bacteroidales bacterium]
MGLCRIFEKIKNNTGCYAILFCTDLDLSGNKIYLYYKSRFQIEFLYRDAKQFTSLTHCHARSENKLHFHFNTSF